LGNVIRAIASLSRLIEDLYRKQYFIDRKVEAQTTYQYHDLFRDFLCAECEHNIDPPELCRYQEQAAAILVDAGEIEQAVTLLQRAGAWPKVAELILDHAEALRHQGRLRTVDAWFQGMPASIIDATLPSSPVPATRAGMTASEVARIVLG
jgi:ATP/maltotriose-dependent transcriptional regulator MalT